MLKRKDLIDELGEEYKPMINEVNIADFQKCIAQYAGMRFEAVSDDIIKEYLVTWARNKKYLYDFFGHLKVDLPIKYVNPEDDKENDLIDLGLRNPAYFSWLYLFKNTKNNKIDTYSWDREDRKMLRMLCPNMNVEGMALTRFFKSILQAPDEIVTTIGRLWENQEVEATFTMSIDPVDIMLSSENPYGWTSCYRLEEFCESHADGCLAGVLDGSTVITYIWNREGKFSLYNNFEFKNVRYKRMRMTIAVNRTLNAIHFNEIYPGKQELSESFHKELRDIVETYFCDKLGKDNMWGRASCYSNLDPYRIYSQYGYGEYTDQRVFMLKNEDHYEKFDIYSELITCPCGCGEDYIGTENGDGLEYCGDGHINENYSEEDTSWENWHVYDEDWNDLSDYFDYEDDAWEFYNSNEEAYYITHEYGDEWDSDSETLASKEHDEEEEE